MRQWELKERMKLKGKGKPRDNEERLEIIKRIFKAISPKALGLIHLHTCKCLSMKVY